MENEWSSIRQGFTVSDKSGKEVYVAEVDGLLRVASTEEPRIIVEVKPNVRRFSDSTYDKIRMQEATQMAAWITEYPYLATQPQGSANTQYRRLLISQDKHEIYVTVATFDDDHIKYIQHRGPVTSFLKLTEFGPFPVTDHKRMRFLGEFMLAMSIQGGFFF
ncbi:hypothetical protein B0H66DRAFT_599418 [Apodospora peruviana]|uniref:Uncharacterized protein n=1 Tax=Apodospora peruviana TaxID=516989 RepID=A0AAE0IIB3_9PEZI|nr:hypothetical protein B0H66DRAFT_599418 [Apodospora peruviana]